MSILAVASGWSAAPASADGDPASDVLATQTVFLPQDAAVPAVQQAQLGELVAAAHRSGYQIRVALVASATDLGSVTALWRQPDTYARFLGQELALVYRGPLLVVMPDGFGLYGIGQPTAGRSALVGVGVSGAELGTAALAAIRRLAAASGHPLPLPTRPVPAASGSAPILPWVAFAIGAALVLAAWTASLRARPLRQQS